MQFRRRQLLKGLGASGVTLLAPFARTLEAEAAGEAVGNFLFFFTPNGFVRYAHGSTGNDAGFTLRESLAACEPHKNKISTVLGLCNKSTTSKASHEEITRLLTCVSGSSMYDGYGPSIDQVVAQHTKTRAMTLSPITESPDWNTKLSFSGPKQLDEHQHDAKKVFADIFGGGIPGGSTVVGPTEDDKTRAARKKKIVDFVREDVTLFQSRLGKGEKDRLSGHLDALNDLEKKLTALPETKTVAACDANKAKAIESAPTGSIKQRGERMMELAAAAFACGLRRSGTILMEKASSGHNPINPSGARHHSISHGEGGGKTEWQKIDAYYGGQFNYLLSQLSGLGVLDNTMVVWGTEISQEHNQNNQLFIVAGGGNLGINHRKSIVMPFTGSEGGKLGVAKDNRNTAVANLWVTVKKALGVPGDTFGDASSGVIPGLYR